MAEGGQMAYPDYYWQRDKDAPFVFFVSVINAYCHPEVGADKNELSDWVHHSGQSEKTAQFKEEFRRLLSGELSKLPEYALFTAAEYEDGSDEAFLTRLWHELYGDEPVRAMAEND
jgi:hypothetical protein